ncbi:MAG: tRNA lysidine(34) synthetase TilS [Sphingobacteriales bacterium]|nr:MAG: tRNA lysidine(34) synthetase TilS [Sphingobacteriales bacterium]
MQPLQKQFNPYWNEQIRIDRSRPVLVAASGGVDSMVLVTLLHQLGYRFAIAHCNFRLRGSASDEDAAFVEAWAAERNIACFRKDFDTLAELEQGGGGIQETARRLRYEWFEQIRKDHSFAAIATAHHADDSAETLLMNLFRGTGIRGLHGIRPRQGKIIRPLLFAGKKDLQAYAAELKIDYREDASNAGNDYSRNALRHQILPAIEAQYPHALRAIAETAARVAAAEPLYEKSIARLRKKLMDVRGADHYLPIRLWQKTESADALLYELLRPFGFTGATIPEIKKLMNAQPGQYLDSETHRLLRHRNFLVLTARNEGVLAADFYLIEREIQTLGFTGGTLTLAEMPVPDSPVGPATEALLDASQLEWPLVVRRWKAGDYFYPLGMNRKKKKVARFLIDQKLSIAQKEHLWVVESGKRIAWVAGLRIDERFKVRDSTTTVLKLLFKPNQPTQKS